MPIAAPNAPNLTIKSKFTIKLIPAPQNTDSINIFPFDLVLNIAYAPLGKALLSRELEITS